jgi:hypothetical protein
MKTKSKELISKYLATFWLVVLLAFLGLQISSDLTSRHAKAENNSTAKGLFLATTASAQASNALPDFKILQPWIPNAFDIFQSQGEVTVFPSFTFYNQHKIGLIRLLKASISINAP